jgi:hypothetical protein
MSEYEIHISTNKDELVNNENMLAKISIKLVDKLVGRFVNEIYTPKIQGDIRLFCKDFLLNELQIYPINTRIYVMNNIDKIFDAITFKVGANYGIKISRDGRTCDSP